MLFRLIKLYSTGKTIYKKILQPAYAELKRDADKLERAELRKKQASKRKRLKKS
jgi:hypothetical protein